MSVKLKTPSNGSVTLAPEDTASDVTLTVPAVAGELFGQGNILGTVSQSSGVPTGAIIERGSNANGGFVKYADGTMICTYVATVTDQAISSAYGSLYEGTRSWTFPSAFSSAPIPINGSGTIGNNASWSGIAGAASTTAVNMRFWDINSRSGQSITLQFSAIGRWY
jgi:hypothetical protein